MITIYGKNACPYCIRAKRAAENNDLEYEYKNVQNSDEFLQELKQKLDPSIKRITMPQIWVDSDYIGGCDEFMDFLEQK